MDVLRRKRLIRVFFIFWLCFLGLAVQLWLIQIKEGPRYASLALQQVSRGVSLEEVPRGRILDRNLLPLSGERWEDRIVVFPEALEDRAVVARELAGILGLDLKEVQNYLEGSPRYLPYRVSGLQAAAIESRGWQGVMVLPVQGRYGQRPLAAQTVGHLGRFSSWEEFSARSRESKKTYRFNDLIGKTGLERYYEEDLKGLRPQRAVRVYADAGGRLLGGPAFELEESLVDRARRDVVLTVDLRIQQIVEDVMDRRLTRGAVVVMEAGSGDILALASRPGFNPARPDQFPGPGLEECFLDRCTALYQPGSVFKTVVAAAALEEGVVTPETKFYCSGAEARPVRCWYDGGHGRIDFAGAFAESCNPAFVETGLKLSAEKLIEYAVRLGLGEQTIIGYPMAADPRQDLKLIAAPYNLVNSSIGQGPVLATPVQVTAMVNAVVSGGVYRTPRLVREVRSSNGEMAREYPADQGRRALAPETARQLRILMAKVTADGVGGEALVPVYGSAGKTGSAQSGDGRVNAWFTGYAPDLAPRYIVTVLVEDGASGSKTAAPVFREIMEQILRQANNPV